jgi:hypothetical protein|tara:strand:- start:949 stop:1638 length:690 start_codon:yes stop_codon:yes gene_type:complete
MATIITPEVSWISPENTPEALDASFVQDEPMTLSELMLSDSDLDLDSDMDTDNISSIPHYNNEDIEQGFDDFEEIPLHMTATPFEDNDENRGTYNYIQQLEQDNKELVEKCQNQLVFYENQFEIMSVELEHYQTILSTVRDNYSKSMSLDMDVNINEEVDFELASHEKENDPMSMLSQSFSLLHLHESETTNSGYSTPLKMSPRALESEFENEHTEERFETTISLCGNE